MKKYILLIGILGMSFCLQAQGNKHWVFFSDKGPEAAYHAEHPDQLLSPRGIERRQRQGLPIDQRDIPVSKTYLQQLREAGVQVVHTSKWLNAASIETDLSLSELQRACPQVADMQAVGSLVRHQAEEASLLLDPPATTGKASFTYGNSEGQVLQVGADCLHDKGFTGEGVLIAVFDAGFLNMDTLAAFDSTFNAGRVQAVWDFVDQDMDLYVENWHGMAVTSTIVGNLPGSFVGTAPHASLLLARTETVFEEVHQEEDNWLAAVEWADSLGADMIQSSLGYSEFDPGEGDYTYQDMNGDVTIITRAADIAADKGILVVSSAGNAGNSDWHYITAPCDADSILCVGAVDGNGIRAGFSSVGPTADGRIKPDVMAWGSGSAIIGISGNPTFASGTSFSAPITCGMVACLVQAHPLRSNMEVIQAVIESSDRYASPDTAYGYGIPNACKADSILDVLDSLALSVEMVSNPERHFKFYPNPTSESIHIQQISLGMKAEAIEVYSINGQLLQTVSDPTLDNGEYLVDVSNIPPGMYLLKLRFFGNQIISHKFIRQ